VLLSNKSLEESRGWLGVYVTRIVSPPITEAAGVTSDGGGSGVTGLVVVGVVG
jgi:hypothetical protein